MNISIIIPVLNEAEKIEELIISLSKLNGDKEIIISDGGSSDGTLEKLNKFNLIIIDSPAGRAVQMNKGAEKATGDILWFVHADSKISTSKFIIFFQYFIKQ